MTATIRSSAPARARGAAAVVAALALVSACSGDDRPAATTVPVATTEPPIVTMRVAIPGEAAATALTPYVTACAASLGVDVVIDPPETDFLSTLERRMAIGRAPDVIELGDADIIRLADLGFLAPWSTDPGADAAAAATTVPAITVAAPVTTAGSSITEATASTTTTTTRPPVVTGPVPEPVTDTLRFGGRTWGVPIGVDGVLLYANLGLLAAADLAVPRTVEELRTVSATLTASAGAPQAGVVLDGDVATWILRLGGTDGVRTNPGPTPTSPPVVGAGGVTIAAPQAAAGVDLFAGLVRDGLVMMPSADPSQIAQARDAFATGQIALLVDRASAANVIRSGAVFAADPALLAAAPVPGTATLGPVAAPIRVGAWAVSADAVAAGREDPARRLVACLDEPDAHVTAAAVTALVPARTDVAASAPAATDTVGLALLAELPTARPAPRLAQSDRLGHALRAGILDVLAGTATSIALGKVDAAYRDVLGLSR